MKGACLEEVRGLLCYHEDSGRGTGVTLAARGSNFREHSNLKSSVGSVGR